MTPAVSSFNVSVNVDFLPRDHRRRCITISIKLSAEGKRTRPIRQDDRRIRPADLPISVTAPQLSIVHAVGVIEQTVVAAFQCRERIGHKTRVQHHVRLQRKRDLRLCCIDAAAPTGEQVSGFRHRVETYMSYPTAPIRATSLRSDFADPVTEMTESVVTPLPTLAVVNRRTLLVGSSPGQGTLSTDRIVIERKRVGTFGLPSCRRGR